MSYVHILLRFFACLVAIAFVCASSRSAGVVSIFASTDSEASGESPISIMFSWNNDSRRGEATFKICFEDGKKMEVPVAENQRFLSTEMTSSRFTQMVSVEIVGNGTSTLSTFDKPNIEDFKEPCKFYSGYGVPIGDERFKLATGKQRVADTSKGSHLSKKRGKPYY